MGFAGSVPAGRLSLDLDQGRSGRKPGPAARKTVGSRCPMAARRAPGCNSRRRWLAALSPVTRRSARLARGRTARAQGPFLFRRQGRCLPHGIAWTGVPRPGSARNGRLQALCHSPADNRACARGGSAEGRLADPNEVGVGTIVRAVIYGVRRGNRSPGRPIQGAAVGRVVVNCPANCQQEARPEPCPRRLARTLTGKAPVPPARSERARRFPGAPERGGMGTVAHPVVTSRARPCRARSGCRGRSRR